MHRLIATSSPIAAAASSASNESSVERRPEGCRLDPAADNAGSSPAATARVPVIALHCSGSDGGQWRKLAAAIGTDFQLYAPNFIGSPPSAHWHGEHAFTLLDE